jgi:hypothetical protein
MKIVLIGFGDIDFHINLLGISKTTLNKLINEIALSLVESNSEIILLPDKGVCFEVAKMYKKLGGKKVIGVVPKSDTDFGINHLNEYIGFKINGVKVFDEIIDSGTWYEENMTHCLFGEKILFLGKSLGSIGELCFGYYLFRLFNKRKKMVTPTKKVDSLFLAGKNISFDALVFSPLIKQKIDFEIERYIESMGSNIIYVDNAKELTKLLK